jgi:hypothetical protein
MQEERFAWVDVKAADRSGGLHLLVELRVNVVNKHLLCMVAAGLPVFEDRLDRSRRKHRMSCFEVESDVLV